MVMSNYEGKISKALRVIQVNIVVGIIIRQTLFVVIPSKVNYNLFLGREWIHGVGAVPSSIHQRISIWRPNSIVENVEADQSFFLSQVNNIDNKTLTNNWLTFLHVFLLEHVFLHKEMCYI